MIENFPPSWQAVLYNEFEKEYFTKLQNFVDKSYNETLCFPDKSLIFNAFYACSFQALKVVIIGQDPYHDNGQANGLSFSVNPSVKVPPSLVNIFKELAADLSVALPQSGDLSKWASQGVLLLNATLTVEAHKAGSHQKQGWEKFTDAVITQISDRKENVVFLLWGGYAQHKGRKIDGTKHLVLKTGHPSPLSANRGLWFGNKHFSKTNEYLISKGKKAIDWMLDQPPTLFTL